MYEDTWYSFVPNVGAKTDDAKSQKAGHRRRESLLNQANANEPPSLGHNETLNSLIEEPSKASPPEATVVRRARSYTDFYHVVRAQMTKELKKQREKERKAIKTLGQHENIVGFEFEYETYEDELLDASQEEFQLYRDQLALSERHVDNLLKDTSSTLDILANLSDSFKAVEAQTTSFRAQCEDLIEEQKRLKTLADEVGTDLQYYGYLEPITRRLNAPGASRVIGDDSFAEILDNLDACVEFMRSHPEHRDSETYLTRYQALLARTLNLIQIVFTSALSNRTAESQKMLSSAQKLNTTTVYLIQSPDGHPIDSKLDRTMNHVAEKAYMALIATPAADRAAGKEPIDAYYALFKTMLNEYVVSRKQLVGSILDQILVVIGNEHNVQTDFRTYARTCLLTTLEICSAECEKYSMFFKARDGFNYKANLAYQDFWRSQAVFNRFLDELCFQAFRVIEQPLRHLDLAASTSLALFLDDYEHTAEDDDDDDADDSSTVDDSRHVDSAVLTKSRLARLFKNEISKVIFTFVKEVAYTQITRFLPKPNDLNPKESISPDEVSAHGEKSGISSEIADTDLNGRAFKAIGAGFSNAYAPLKTGVHLLIIINDLTFDSNTGTGMGEMAYEIIHETSTAIMRGAAEIAKTDRVDSYVFAVKNLILLKNLILAYEISGSRQAAAIDFTRMWTTFSSLRSRGGLFDLRAYYSLITSGELLPEVVTTIQDARIELDGLLREVIAKVRQECANQLWKEYGKPLKGNSEEGKVKLKGKLEAAFRHEKELRDTLWSLVEDTLQNGKQ